METPSFWIRVLIFILFVALPIYFVVIGSRLTLKTLRFKERAQSITGTVVEIIKTNSPADRHSEQFVYQPVFEFPMPDGSVLRGKSASISSNMNYTIGSQHPILVDFDDPATVHTKGNHALIIGVMCILLGGIAAAFGLSAVFSMI
ncbi:DUF3592 domain-containing protein [Parasedimentitalea marina]|uniref:DUF3592 domain-containing protein n=1 Tax=Parasedimentitalea marina TaxID=2483033 RepID=UPI0013E2A2C5|nr:DUF3592 domain-containing protein [Parasedimentitalea marina]